jgi:hypothetical protein
MSEAPNIPERFGGAGYVHELDHERLGGQMLRIWEVMSDHQWRSVEEIHRITGFPTTSISANLRSFRKEKVGAYLVESRRVTDNGLYEYRVGNKGEGTPQRKACPSCEEVRQRNQLLETLLVEVGKTIGIEQLQAIINQMQRHP